VRYEGDDIWAFQSPRKGSQVFSGGGCNRAEGSGWWIGSFRFATTALYIALNLGLVELHADEEFFPHSAREWTDPAQESHGGHNHVACLIFWNSAPSPTHLPAPPQITEWRPVPLEPEVVVSPPLSHRRKGPLPRGPPLVA